MDFLNTSRGLLIIVDFLKIFLIVDIFIIIFQKLLVIEYLEKKNFVNYLGFFKNSFLRLSIILDLEKNIVQRSSIVDCLKKYSLKAIKNSGF